MKFNTNGLLSKWGFMDGDILEDFMFDSDLCDNDINQSHKSLIKVVVDHVIPKLDQEVELSQISTIHNPIRAKSVDGKNVNWYRDDGDILTPSVVEVSDDVIIEIIKSIS